MLKFSNESKHGTVYFLGLSRENIDKLTSGRPIAVNLEDLGGPSATIGILFGETDRLLFDNLRKQGLIPVGVPLVEVQIGTAEAARIKRESQDQENSSHEPSE